MDDIASGENACLQPSGGELIMGIDHARLQRELDLVREELSGQFRDAQPGQISHAINTAAAELVPQATIGDFPPILIRRRAPERLRTRQ
ncbi:hypothetical protein AB0H34_19315 [Saccharopolyspora shandongensis]|uniref:three-helix bundle dimerization domain-containing protein n=1 Tax=Saccharopolyspora shandongensis TaxID=418495 RepID=UPI0033E0AFB6